MAASVEWPAQAATPQHFRRPQLPLVELELKEDHMSPYWTHAE